MWCILLIYNVLCEMMRYDGMFAPPRPLQNGCLQVCPGAQVHKRTYPIKLARGARGRDVRVVHGCAQLTE